jgi:hypothetical protein
MNNNPSLDVLPISVNTNHDVRFAPQEPEFLEKTQLDYNANVTVSKFDTCLFRSKSLQERTIKRCACKGGDFILQGYYCSAKDLFQVTPEICSNCELYKS